MVINSKIDLSNSLNQKAKANVNIFKLGKKSIKQFRDRDFSEYCEYVVAFKLVELGWKVYQPLSDRYIDIVALKEVNGKTVMRTIQVKGSRIEKEGEQLTYGLTHKPKDLMHDSAHFFIWLFFDKSENENFIVLSVSDFVELMGESFFKSMSWRKGNCRIHFGASLSEGRLSKYLNNWKKLELGGRKNTFELCVGVQEIDKNWRFPNVVEEWRKTNSKILRRIPKDMLNRIKRKTEID